MLLILIRKACCITDVTSSLTLWDYFCDLGILFNSPGLKCPNDSHTWQTHEQCPLEPGRNTEPSFRRATISFTGDINIHPGTGRVGAHPFFVYTKTYTEKKQSTNLSRALDLYLTASANTKYTHNPVLTLWHLKINQNCSWDQRCGTMGRESDSFCVCVCVFFWVSLYMCVCGGGVIVDETKLEIERCQVRGGTHPLNPPLLTLE